MELGGNGAAEGLVGRGRVAGGRNGARVVVRVVAGLEVHVFVLLNVAVDGRDVDVRELKLSVAAAVAEGETRSDAATEEVTVVDVETLVVVDVGVGRVNRDVVDLGGVVRTVAGNCVGKATGGVVVTVKDVDEGATRLLTRKTSPKNTSYIWVVDPLLDVDGADGVDDNDGVVACGSDSLDKVVAVVPRTEVVAVTDLKC